jgi:hypothetical protein
VSETPGSGGGSGPPAPQRRWQAPCPNCGAPVEFQSAASVSAICGYCRSSVLRDGEALRRIGQSAELFADRGLLQLGSSGRWQQRGFTLVGRVQYGYGKGGAALSAPAEVEGTWSEWHALFDDGASGWLSEDNDQYVMAFAVRSDVPPPAADALRVGQPVELVRKLWRVASLTRSSVLAAQGELPVPPALGRSQLIADLRNAQEQVATLEYADGGPPLLSVGVPARPADLELRNLRQDSLGRLAAQGFPCPNCGAPVEPKLSGTQSISCVSCYSVIDLSRGVGAQLQAYRQMHCYVPRIPLGRSGRLAVGGLPPLDWQVVGFARRNGVGVGADSFTWDDYLLYNQREGFVFLNDTEEGWVGWRTLTGALGAGRTTAAFNWEGDRYRLTASYTAEVRYVEGEFYWKVTQGQHTRNSDFTGTGKASGKRLSREESESEVIWSRGKPIAASFIAAAFHLDLGTVSAAVPAIQPDVAPLSHRLASWFSTLVVWLIIIFLIGCWIFVGINGPRDDDAEYYGGSYGGYSTGGGHK